jgi:hypothetical protein
LALTTKDRDRRQAALKALKTVGLPIVPIAAELLVRGEDIFGEALRIFAAQPESTISVNLIPALQAVLSRANTTRGNEAMRLLAAIPDPAATCAYAIALYG